VSTPRRLLLSPRAAADLEEIADYITRDNPARAASFVAELEAKCRGQGCFGPHVGISVSRTRPSYISKSG
jgi:plasmid stabilization system protein ParE